MLEEYKKIIIISGSALILLILLLVFMFVDVSLGPIKISSISTILKQYDRVTLSESELALKQSAYKTTILSLENEKKNFKTEKEKYEVISDETVKIIKEANTTQEYSIEYMWIRLGNYAKVNNLSIVLVEPGGAAQTEKTATNNSNSGDTQEKAADSTTTTTSDTKNEEETNKSQTDVQTDTTKKEKTTNTQTTNTQQGGNFKIQVSGSYMNVSDFIFAVENDSELRFKLDNISMEYVSGTTIKATFDVKNMVIKK